MKVLVNSYGFFAHAILAPRERSKGREEGAPRNKEPGPRTPLALDAALALANSGADIPPWARRKSRVVLDGKTNHSRLGKHASRESGLKLGRNATPWWASRARMQWCKLGSSSTGRRTRTPNPPFLNSEAKNRIYAFPFSSRK